MDALTDVLQALELKGWLHSRTEMVLPWRFDFLASPDSIFHLLCAGRGYLSVEGEATPRRVESGDVLLIPFGHAHSIGNELSSPLTRTVQLAYSAHREYQVFPFEGEEPKMVLLCGAFHFEHPDDYPFLRCLPKVIHIPGEQGRRASPSLCGCWHTNPASVWLAGRSRCDG